MKTYVYQQPLNIVLQNRQMGPEQVMQIVEDRAPDGFKKPGLT
jgi:hypothetical protein